MNSEEKIYSKIKNASQKGEKDFPGMDKVWNRVEEKLDNTIVVKKKNSWQKLAIAASVLLSFSIIYHFVSNDEVIKDTNSNFNNPTENPIIVSKDSVNKIIEKAREVVVDNNEVEKLENKINPTYSTEKSSAETSYFPEAIAPSAVLIDDSAAKLEMKEDNSTLVEKGIISNELNKNAASENEASFRNSALNSSSSNNNGYIAQGKKYAVPAKEVKSKYKAKAVKAAKSKVVSEEKSDDIVVIDGVVKDQKELDNLNHEDFEITHYKKPLYIINGIEYTEESLFGKKPTSPYAPLDKQEIITINIVKDVDAMKIYGKKGENGVIIITTKDGKPVKK